MFCLLDSALFAAIDVYSILYLRNCSLRLCLVAHKWNQILHFMDLWILGLNVTFLRFKFTETANSERRSFYCKELETPFQSNYLQPNATLVLICVFVYANVCC